MHTVTWFSHGNSLLFLYPSPHCPSSFIHLDYSLAGREPKHSAISSKEAEYIAKNKKETQHTRTFHFVYEKESTFSCVTCPYLRNFFSSGSHYGFNEARKAYLKWFCYKWSNFKKKKEYITKSESPSQRIPSLRPCFSIIHDKDSIRRANLCFQETHEHWRGADGGTLLLLCWRKGKAGLHGDTPRSEGLGEQCWCWRQWHKEKRVTNPTWLLLPAPHRVSGLPAIFCPGHWFLSVLMFSSAFFIEIQLHGTSFLYQSSH